MNAKKHFHFPKLENNLIARVFNHQPVERVPVWMMRQAGRCDPEYRRLRQEDGRPLEELFRDVDMSIKISLLPRRFGVDAIIMFQDILTPLEPMGAGFHFNPGPVLEEPITDLERVHQLKIPHPVKDLKNVGRILSGLKSELGGSLPLLGFAGAPVTLALFMIAGKSPNQKMGDLIQFMDDQPHFTQSLLDKLTSVTIDYLNYQIECGANAVQLFESFANSMPKPFYQRWAQPCHEKIFRSLKREIPSILFAKEFSDLDLMASSGAAALSVGSVVDLNQAISKFPELIFQGNVDNRILAQGNSETIREATENCLKQTHGKRHILNLNHGLLENTSLESVINFINISKSIMV